jgi:hypothetical protein
MLTHSTAACGFGSEALDFIGIEQRFWLGIQQAASTDTY